MKKILLIGIVGTFVFAGVNFNKGVTYGGLDGTVTVAGTMGVNFDLNDSMSLGWDTGRCYKTRLYGYYFLNWCWLQLVVWWRRNKNHYRHIN